MANKRTLGAGSSSKLAATATTEPDSIAVKPQTIGLISKTQPTRKPRSYRLRPDDLERLTQIVEKVNELGAGRKITETDVLRGLITLGTKTTGERLLEAIRESLL